MKFSEMPEEFRKKLLEGEAAVFPVPSTVLSTNENTREVSLDQPESHWRFDDFQQFLGGRLQVEAQGVLSHVSPPRIVLYNVVFDENVDLRDGRTPSGGPLPALEFHNCEFKKGFCADGARLERLMFRCCHFTAQEDVDSVPWPKNYECKTPANRRMEGAEKQQAADTESPEEAKTTEAITAYLFPMRAPQNCISLRNCRIETELHVAQLSPFGNGKKQGLLTIDAFAIRVGTNIRISDTTLRAQHGESHDLSVDAHYALNLATAIVSGDIMLRPAVVLEGGLRLRDAQVGGSIWMDGLKSTHGENHNSKANLFVKGKTPRFPILMDTIDVQGNVLLHGARIEGAISLMHANLVGRLTLSMDKAETVGMTGATVKGIVEIEAETPWFESSQLIVQGPAILRCRGLRRFNLYGATISGDLDVTGCVFEQSDFLDKPELVIQRKLTCYKDAIYIEARWAVADWLQDFAFLVFERPVLTGNASELKIPDYPGQVFWLNGDSNIFHQLNAQGALQLEKGEDSTEEARVREYLELFCASVWGEEGSFAIVRTKEYLPQRFQTGEVEGFNPDLLTVPIRTITVLPEGTGETQAGKAPVGQKAWEADAYVRYSNFLFKAIFRLETDGRVEMKEDQPIVEYADGDAVFSVFCVGPKDPSKRGTRVIPTDFADQYHPDLHWEKNPNSDVAPSVLEGLHKIIASGKLLRPVYADLRGASCKILKDWDYNPSTTPEKRSNTESKGEEFNKASSESSIRLVWPLQTTYITEFNYRQLDPGKANISGALDSVRKAWVRGETPIPESDGLSGLLFLGSLGLLGLLLLFSLDSASYLPPRPAEGNSYWFGFKSLAILCVLAGVSIGCIWMVRRKRLVPVERSPSFDTQPYAHLAAVLRERGNDDFARLIESEKLWQEVEHRARSGDIRSWVTKQILWRPYRVMFGLGLSPSRAFTSLLLFWFLGWASVQLLSYNDMLRASVSWVAPAVIQKPHGKREPAQLGVLSGKGQEEDGRAEADFSCQESIEPSLYAFELMMPIINLHQESRCEIRSSPAIPESKNNEPEWHVTYPWDLLKCGWFWEYAKAVYMLIGSIITSLALLTFSGIARRWEH